MVDLNSNWLVFADASMLQAEARRRVQALARDAIAARGSFHVVLAGGSTPRALYVALCDLDTDWSRWHVYFGDERVLSADAPERNSRMAMDAWLARVPVPAAQVHPMATERGLMPAVQDYAELLEGVGEFDLVLLGLGEDGHTASLFPGQDWGEGVDAPEVLAVSDAPKPPAERVSLSAQRLSRSRWVMFLVTGAGKRDAIARWQRGERIPAAAIKSRGKLEVLLDAAAMPPA